MTVAAVLALASTSVVVVSGRRWRPLGPRPLAGLPVASSPREMEPAWLANMVDSVGRVAHTRLPASSVLSSRATGTVVLTAAALTLVDLPLAVGVLGLVSVVAWWRGVTSQRRRRMQVEADLPTATELLVVALLSGCPITLGMERVAAVHSGVVAADWAALLRRVELGGVFDEELLDWGGRSGESCERLAEQIIGARRSGASIADGLRRLAGDHRELARRAAEERARRLPVLMLLPLAVCILPAFILVAVVPVAVSGAGSVGFP